MHDIADLEMKWKLYRKHKNRRYGLIFIVSISVLIGVYFYNTKNIYGMSNLVYMPKQDINNMGFKEFIDTAIEPEKDIMDTTNRPIIKEIPILDDIKVKSEKSNNKSKKNHFVIHKSSTVKDYLEVEKRFYTSKNINDSLFLARGYYAQGLYDKSEYWALETNKINSKLEESWMIFIHSKLKQGDKNAAIYILKNYIKSSHSSVANKLLNKLKKL